LLVTGLEGFSSNEIDYACGYQDTAKIICYDFKEEPALVKILIYGKIWISRY